MNKTVTINLGGLIFNIEELAYDKLKQYLDSIKMHYAGQSGNDEIINDIEARAAEEFSTKINKAKQVIIIEDVDDLIKTLGTVEAITEENQEEQKTGEEKTKIPLEAKNKKLFRDSDDIVIAGVCSGIASFFGLDPVIVRLLFVASIFFGGFGIFAYIILWIVMPEAKTTTEKMQMRGEPITLSGLEDAVKKNFKTKSGEQNLIIRIISLPIKFIEQIFSLIGRLARKIIPIFSVLFGVAAGFIFLIGFGASLFAFANLLFNINSPYIDFPLNNIISGPLYYGAVSAGFFIAIVPLIFILIAGISLIRRKLSFGLISSLSMILIWIISIISLSVIAIKVAPNVQKAQADREQKNITQTIQNIPNFESVSVRGNQKIQITKGENFSVIAKGQEDSIKEMQFEVVDNVLKIKRDEKNKICIFCVNDWTPIDVIITMPKLSSFASGDRAQTTIKGFNEKNIKFQIYSNSNLTAEIQASSTDIEIDGLASATLLGTSTNIIVKLEDNSDFNGYQFIAEQANLDISDHGEAKINAKTINYSLDDLGKIYYKGEPQIINSEKNEKVIEDKNIEKEIKSEIEKEIKKELDIEDEIEEEIKKELSQETDQAEEKASGTIENKTNE